MERKARRILLDSAIQRFVRAVRDLGRSDEGGNEQVPTLEVNTLWSARYEHKDDDGETVTSFTPWFKDQESVVDAVGENNGSIKTVYVREGGEMHELVPGGGTVPIG